MTGVRGEDFFTPEGRRAIEDAVAKAEAKTSAEIVPVVAASSARYARAEDALGIWCGVLGLVALGLAHPERQLDLVEALVVFFLGLGLGAGVLARIDALKRALTGRADREARALEAAQRLFLSQRIGRTASRTGVLLYLSVFEHAAVVLSDERAGEALGPGGVERLRDLLVEGAKGGRPAEGFARAVTEAGERLAKGLPRAASDRNELPDRLVVLG